VFQKLRLCAQRYTASDSPTSAVPFDRSTRAYYIILELKPIVVALQWALVRTYWIDEPLE